MNVAVADTMEVVKDALWFSLWCYCCNNQDSFASASTATRIMLMIPICLLPYQLL
jgi:hypothetical protein